MQQAADSLRALADHADPFGVDILGEDHGGLTSNGKPLAGVMKLADHPRVGTLPDFGNFDLDNGERYDPYEGVRELMPWAEAVLDVMPADDLGVREGLRRLDGLHERPAPKQVLARAEVWAPLRSVASWVLWRLTESKQ